MVQLLAQTAVLFFLVQVGLVAELECCLVHGCDERFGGVQVVQGVDVLLAVVPGVLILIGHRFQPVGQPQPFLKQLGALIQGDAAVTHKELNGVPVLLHAQQEGRVEAVDGVKITAYTAGQLHIALFGRPLVDEPRGGAHLLAHQVAAVIQPVVLEIAPPLVDEEGQHICRHPVRLGQSDLRLGDGDALGGLGGGGSGAGGLIAALTPGPPHESAHHQQAQARRQGAPSDPGGALGAPCPLGFLHKVLSDVGEAVVEFLAFVFHKV